MNSARIKLVLLFALFASPFALAWIAYHFWQPKSFVNRGTLLNPVIVLSEVPLAVDQAAPAKWDQQSRINGKWLLVQVDALPCAAACETKLIGMRQAHAALGKNQTRVQRAFVLDGTAQFDAAFAARVPDLVWLKGEMLQAQLAKAVPQGGAQKDFLFVVDPLGNLMLRYPATVDLKDVVKDMERLLKASRIG